VTHPIFKAILLFAFSLSPLLASNAQTEIHAILDAQVADWNKGDLPGFVSYYADPATLVGKTASTISRAQILEHYRTAYGIRAAMGTLSFTNLVIQPLDAQIAVVTANWHLDRNAASGGPVGGVFSLVLQRRSTGWQIVLDHTN
jgi:ketosteroid isomerase-like protein